MEYEQILSVCKFTALSCTLLLMLFKHWWFAKTFGAVLFIYSALLTSFLYCLPDTNEVIFNDIFTASVWLALAVVECLSFRTDLFLKEQELQVNRIRAMRDRLHDEERRPNENLVEMDLR